ncbi:uncharacterized protein UTRI_01241 [Ustilago trichophora]|uniref:Uncharacterized protein n=1 Tax=Ustilago trichophora TaxID=86804 RepID=A0A5C3DVW0_9BASI|nr:uncharacterized protein UTRI_01241 [Ustilago trichophora]
MVQRDERAALVREQKAVNYERVCIAGAVSALERLFICWWKAKVEGRKLAQDERRMVQVEGRTQHSAVDSLMSLRSRAGVVGKDGGLQVRVQVGGGGVCVGECSAADEAAAMVRHGSVALCREERWRPGWRIEEETPLLEIA